ncbi:MAG: hypothetical protein IPO87_07735 [Flavobacteriales bacterium]|nr:hypothetical protein [Flavobacteriales bacterium]
MVSARQSTRGGTTSGFLQRLTGAGTTTWSSTSPVKVVMSANLLCMAFNNNNIAVYFGGVTEGLNSANISAGGVHDITTTEATTTWARMDLDQNFLDGTYIGGRTTKTNMMGLNVDQNNDAYRVRVPNSNNFPTSAAPNVPLQTGLQGEDDKVFFKLESDLSVLKFSTYLAAPMMITIPLVNVASSSAIAASTPKFTSERHQIPLTQVL